MKKDLEALLDLHVEMANDANCFALAEARLGVVKEKFPDAQVVFGVILGTGVGGGVVVNGHVINGHHGIGGEWGHNELPGFEGRRCFVEKPEITKAYCRDHHWSGSMRRNPASEKT
jgi:fructokinase